MLHGRVVGHRIVFGEQMAQVYTASADKVAAVVGESVGDAVADRGEFIGGAGIASGTKVKWRR